jgi:hypothetical protein
MKLTVTTNRNGKHAIGVHCPQDGRHFRGFINHKPYVAEMLSRVAEAMAERTTAGETTAKALQKAGAVQASSSGRTRRRRA